MAGPKTDEKGQIQPRNGKEQKQGARLADLLKQLQPEIARALPKHMTPDRMARVVLTALRTTPDLAECSAASFMAAIMTAAQLGLEPNTPLGHLYLIPRKMKVMRNGHEVREMTCTVQIGYQGFLELARRSGLAKSIYAHAVREGDHFTYELGLNPTLEHKPSDNPKRLDQKIKYVYAVCHLRDSDPVFEVLTIEQVLARKERGGTGDKFSPWKSDFEAMVRKTGIRALWRWMPKSAEMQLAEAAETLEEIGRAPTALLEPQTTHLLAQAGVFPPVEEPVAEYVTDIDPDTGEVIEPPPAEPTPSNAS